MSNNPFETGNDAPADPWATSTPDAPEAPTPAPTDARHPFSIKLTLKANASHNAEWINPWVSGATAEEAAQRTVEMLNALAKFGVIDRTAAAAQYTREQYKGDTGPARSGGNGGGGGQRSNSQQTTAPPPGVQQEYCAHGAMEFRTGTSRKGNAYKVWSCTEPDQSKQCKGIFVK